jgi:glycerol-1-phosphate dehydrogenase [NAD(P)+]
MCMPLIKVPEGLDTKFFLLAPGAIQFLPELLATYFPGLLPWIIADGNTWAAAGDKVQSLFRQAQVRTAQPYIFAAEPQLHPDYEHALLLCEKMPAACLPLAVGSGVINDLVKCAAGLKGVSYCCLPTACSVDGYTSAGAALSMKGNKQTVKCPAPIAVCADPEILTTAPAPMLASGYADLLTKIPAGADWIIADIVGEDPIRQDVWDLIQGNIRGWIADHNNMLEVFAGLAATGYAMQMMQDSRPASGAEHLLSHVWEMEGLQKDGAEVSHGFKVGIGLLASTLLMEFVFEHDFSSLKARMKPGLSRVERHKEIQSLLQRNCYGRQPEETALQKFKEGDALLERRQLIENSWPRLQAGLRRQLIPFQEIRAMLRAANCPTSAQEIGLGREQFLDAVKTAQLIRKRYTILDLLYEIGLLDAAMHKLQVITN